MPEQSEPDTLAKISASLEEILKWQKIQGIKTIREMLPKLLDTEQKKIAYELTDGNNSREEVQKGTGAGAGTISRWWISWFSYGLLSKEGQKYKKIISLSDVGMDVKLKGSNSTLEVPEAQDTLNNENAKDTATTQGESNV